MGETTQVKKPAGTLLPKGRRLAFLLGAAALLACLAVFLMVRMPTFYEFNNIMNLLVQTSSISIMAFGITFLLISGNIDLSMPAVMWFSSSAAAVLIRDTGAPAIVAVPVILAICLLCAAINGVAVSKFMMLPFIATLAMQIVAKGGATIISRGYAVAVPALLGTLGNGYVGPVPISIFYLAVSCVVLHMLLSRTAFGRSVYAVGINASAAENCGISLQRVRSICYLIAGCCVFVATIITTGRLQSAAPSMAADTIPLDIICAAVIGGVSINGGSGTIYGALIGTLMLMTFQNILNLFSVDAYVIMMLKGLLIIATTSFDTLMRGGRRVS